MIPLILVLLVAISEASTGMTPQEDTPRTNGTRAASDGATPDRTRRLQDGATSGVIVGLSTWYCGGGSPCTRGTSPGQLVAAIDPGLGIPRGTWIRVTHGGNSVTTRVVDVCACAGRRIVDLSRAAFSRLADPSRGVIPVSLVVVRERPKPPDTSMEGAR